MLAQMIGYVFDGFGALLECSLPRAVTNSPLCILQNPGLVDTSCAARDHRRVQDFMSNYHPRPECGSQCEALAARKADRTHAHISQEAEGLEDDVTKRQRCGSSMISLRRLKASQVASPAPNRMEPELHTPATLRSKWRTLVVSGRGNAQTASAGEPFSIPALHPLA